MADDAHSWKIFRKSVEDVENFPHPYERVAIGEAIEKELQGRQLATLKQNSEVENFPQRHTPEGKTRDLVAKATG